MWDLVLGFYAQFIIPVYNCILVQPINNLLNKSYSYYLFSVFELKNCLAKYDYKF